MRLHTKIWRILFNQRTYKNRLGLLLYTTGILSLISILFILYLVVYKLELRPWYPSVDHWCDRESIPEHLLRLSPDDITVVTMFLDLGVFKKGEATFAYHSPFKYKRWMRVFGRLANPVVAFMEKKSDIEYFRQIRSCLPSHLTTIIKVQRDELPSFKQLPQIRAIYSQLSYPKIHPNTIYPEYTCAMNVKYDILTKACIDDFYKTRYFAWLDIGLFRGLDGTQYEVFKLAPPAEFDPRTVAFSQAWPISLALPVERIMKEKLVWVSGAMVLATKEKMLNFSKSYKQTVTDLLLRGLSNTDQEVIHSMYSEEMKKSDQVGIQTFSCQQGQFNLQGADARYFCLGYASRDAWEKTHSRSFKTKD